MSLASISYQNPVWPGYLANPFVLRVGDDYYAYGVGSDKGSGRQTDGRVFPVLHSSNLVEWTLLGGALAPLSDAAKIVYSAPEVAESIDRFFLYYAADDRLRVAFSDSPAGPFLDSDRDLFPNEPFAIDPHPFKDPADGQWYLFFAKDFFDEQGGTGIVVVPLADDMMTPLTEPRVAFRAMGDWQISARTRTSYGGVWPVWHAVEDPCVIEHAGHYYCLYSGGRRDRADCGLSCAVADHPLGPYRDDGAHVGPVVLRGRPGQLSGAGHGSIVRAPCGDRLLVVYATWDETQSVPRMCIDPLEWTKGGPRCTGPSEEPRLLLL